VAEIFDVGGLGQHLRRLTPEEKALRLAAFYRILDGKTSSINELALQSGVTADQAQRYIRDMIGRGILVIDEQGFVVGSHGLSLITTDHRLRINGRNLFTWCAADAVGIPAALGVDAKIISKCFQCNEPIEIVMVSGEIQYSSQENTCIWVIEADLDRPIVSYA
jgi:alkylmercury lyase